MCIIQLRVPNEENGVFLQSISICLLKTLTAIAVTVIFPYSVQNWSLF